MHFSIFSILTKVFNNIVKSKIIRLPLQHQNISPK